MNPKYVEEGGAPCLTYGLDTCNSCQQIPTWRPVKGWLVRSIPRSRRSACVQGFWDPNGFREEIMSLSLLKVGTDWWTQSMSRGMLSVTLADTDFQALEWVALFEVSLVWSGGRVPIWIKLRSWAAFESKFWTRGCRWASWSESFAAKWAQYPGDRVVLVGPRGGASHVGLTC